MSTLEQQRARFALDRVEEVKDKPNVAKFKTQLLKLPARLHNNGLGQTVGYLLAQRPESPEATICGWLETWLRTPPAGPYPPGVRLIECVVGSPGQDPEDVESRYRTASAEARVVANWLKRFAEAFLVGEVD